MGPNSKRAQRAAAASRDVPSRARFSKPPPSKNKGGRGGGRGGGGRGQGRGRGGGRGGRGGQGGRSGSTGGKANHNSQSKRGNDKNRSSSSNGASRAHGNVIDKISKRVQDKVNDTKKSSNVADSSSNLKKHPLAGIDVSKLDEVTLSEELIQVVTKILTDLNVMESSTGSENPGKSSIKSEESDNNDEEKKQEDEENDPESVRESPLFLHLTKRFSFSTDHATRACMAIQNWTNFNDDANNEGEDSTDEIALAIDWLCLHLTEDELKRGFKQKKKNRNLDKLTSKSTTIQDDTGNVKAVSHPSISVAKSISSDQDWQKLFTKESRILSFVRLGFHKAESERAYSESDNSTLINSAEDDSPAIRSLLSILEKEITGKNSDVDHNNAITAADLDYVASERDQEVEALRAIFDDQFEVRSASEGGSGIIERYVLKIDANERLQAPARSEENRLHVFLRVGYPVFTPAQFLFTNPTLPPSLLRRINIAMIHEAHSSIGDPLVFSMANYLCENLSDLQREFTKETRRKESEAELRLRRKEEKQCPTKSNENTGKLSRAEIVVSNRSKQRVQEEAESASRAAMAKALGEGKSAVEARVVATQARNECLQHHGYEVAEQDDQLKLLHDEEKKGLLTNSDDGNQNKKQEEIVGTKPSVMESLRQSLKEQTATEKKNGAVSESNFRGYQLTDASKENDPFQSEEHMPTPVAVPTGDLGNIMEDVVKQQIEQPWLVSKEARVPLIVNNSNEFSPAHRLKQERISEELRKKLNSWHDIAEQCRQNGGGRGKDEYKMLSQRERLPAYQIKEDIVKTIASNQITVVSGATGSGKSTQVPQLVLDDMILNDLGSQANIIVTQPRRISAIGVADRIASERCERVGETIGYSIRLENKRSSKTRLLLCTTGILLRRLQCDPDLASVSHVFVDEVHERDINTDFLLIILRDLLRRRNNLKLVLMSATLNAETFSTYFGGCPTVSIPGRTFPVRENRLEDVLALTGYEVKEGSDYAVKKSSNKAPRYSKSELKKMYPHHNSKVISSLQIANEGTINYELIAELIEYIAKNEEEGAILVFMPGLMEITKTIEELQRKDMFQDPSKTVIYPLHSSLSTAEQTAVFQVPQQGIRKIVVATNIAETSITIEDVVFVVDSGRVKENRQDEINQMMALVECWVSRASAKQRRGRAGRVRPGTSYHLYSSHTNQNDMQEYQLPEMLRVGLEDLVLQILLLDLGEPGTFLTKAVNPPSALAIYNSLKLLEGLGAVDCEWGHTDKIMEGISTANDENAPSCISLSVTSGLTALGFHLATLPVDPRVGKMMIYGALFGCIEPALTIAASMSARNPFVSPFDKRDEADAARKKFAKHGSDHLTTLEAFNKWKDIRKKKGNKAVQSFLRDSFLSRMTLFGMEDLRKQYCKLLVDIGFLPRSFRLDQHKGNDQLNVHMVKAILCAGLYPNVMTVPKNAKKPVGSNALHSLKGEVFLHPCTISFTEEKLESNYCVYHEIVKTTKTYVRDCTPVSKFALLLFGGNLKVYHMHGVVTVDDWLRFKITAKSATLVKHLRSQMERMLLAKIVSPEEDTIGSSSGQSLINAVSTLLERESLNNPSSNSNAPDRKSTSKVVGQNKHPNRSRGGGEDIKRRSNQGSSGRVTSGGEGRGYPSGGRNQGGKR